MIPQAERGMCHAIPGGRHEGTLLWCSLPDHSFSMRLCCCRWETETNQAVELERELHMVQAPIRAGMELQGPQLTVCDSQLRQLYL